ncbi:MAG: hypothetical protein M3495_19070 [Pseudomonadota bacterium]|nr:hypothetical protein [Gammaproteobacteria bacterium]MDQ3583571.1 hypothetical protein [Pseudomonadota bacterium]
MLPRAPEHSRLPGRSRAYARGWPAGGCLVFTLSALHDEEQIERLVDAFRRAI